MRLFVFFSCFLAMPLLAQKKAFDSKEALDLMHRANAYFQAKWPEVGRPIPRPDRIRPSNIWTRSVYYEGLLELHRLDPKEKDLAYIRDWASFHQYQLRDGIKTRNADNQACGQIYLELFETYRDSAMIRPIKANLDLMLASDKADDWSWIDCLQMSMPVFARMGRLTQDKAYWEKMHDLYRFTKFQHGDHGLQDPKTKFWYRDKDFDPPYVSPNGAPCFWSRGNGWVMAALVRTLEQLPKNAIHRKEYIQDLQGMANALLACQHPQGYWNVNLLDPSDYGGPELSGTALFVYGMAYGIRTGLLPKKRYLPALLKAWGFLKAQVQEDGFLSYVQGTGKEPKEGQPLGLRKIPDFEDFGLGCFLLAGAEMIQLHSK